MNEWIHFAWLLAAGALAVWAGCRLYRSEPPAPTPELPKPPGRYTPSNEPMQPERLVQGGGVARAMPIGRVVPMRRQP